MENKNTLLEKLGYSKDYLKLINTNCSEINSQQIDIPTNIIENQILVNELTSFIIDKSERPMNAHFIYNEK